MFRLNAVLIRELLLKRQLSISAFSRLAGLHEVTVRKVIDDGAKVTLRTLSKLADALSVNGNELIQKKG